MDTHYIYICVCVNKYASILNVDNQLEPQGFGLTWK